MKKRVLGKGLGALLPDLQGTEQAPQEIDIDRITLNPDQPRFKLDEKSLEELAESVRKVGVLQPVLVRPAGDGYQLIAGERRLTAAQRAGLLKIPAVVREIPDDRLLELALIENIQREQLNPIEEAQAFQNLLENLRLTQEELAARLARERSTIANCLRLLKLPPAVKLLIAEGKLSPGHARALLSSGVTSSEIARVAQTMVDQSWSVRDAERWALRQNSKKTRKARVQDPNVSAAGDRLRLFLGTKVEILSRTTPSGSGQIRIHFFSQEDLERIYSIITTNRGYKMEERT
jgi:ParB family transcriptional regulator, chromosome partitioning protein